MMYHEGLVVVVKCNGKILREDKDIVNLPFGSEYSILIKNLKTRKAAIKVSIDGTDVLNGSSLILLPNKESELEGVLEGNKVKNKFKFIEKTQEISDYRGDKIDDGIIRVVYWFEQKYYTPTTWLYNNHTIDPNLDNICYRKRLDFSDNQYSSNLSSNLLRNVYRSVNNNNISANVNKSINTDGITVKGSETNQDFNYGYIGTLERESKVIILKLIGYKESGKPIEEPITIKTKKTCPTCGKKSKSFAKFCNRCGTFLLE